jgi:hypothetical protein
MLGGTVSLPLRGTKLLYDFVLKAWQGDKKTNAVKELRS